ncbi:lipopolysaccharide assembly protein LapA domain-containing protein [Brevibacterium sp. 50QC2O2]|jgi:uncharacterized integral membrane protein|uniref:LapA family protein n=1 Tax=Brevibacterium TaxID=1696 RepID=UPI00211D0EEE|nr:MULTISPECIES: lipopolysaccharide assembly protein LapA domain-containing protein [unclassified Brevibacterium]MCQ9368394.1 lipopolysaccharide assembly protein LapA domain-containing protein [Brevibacterium sp. 91QC2O2]MCQ9384722.1 lipopolysaccharide assembly protein LapA domain-containing protein [Brevibacterium sp. 68QC2CO]MCQ9387485.1 lipopolysaccharide assembly protein LapA domain-containing protein [Brevibacterium sp. 50QC2O2]
MDESTTPADENSPVDPQEQLPGREVIAASDRTGSPDALEPTQPTGEDGPEAPTEAEVVPPVTVPGTSGLSIGMWISLIVGAVVLVLLLVFIVQNNEAAVFHYFGWEFSLPLGVAIILSAIAGILIAGVVGSVRIMQLSHRLHKVGKALK